MNDRDKMLLQLVSLHSSRRGNLQTSGSKLNCWKLDWSQKGWPALWKADLGSDGEAGRASNSQSCVILTTQTRCLMTGSSKTHTHTHTLKVNAQKTALCVIISPKAGEDWTNNSYQRERGRKRDWRSGRKATRQGAADSWFTACSVRFRGEFMSLIVRLWVCTSTSVKNSMKRENISASVSSAAAGVWKEREGVYRVIMSWSEMLNVCCDSSSCQQVRRRTRGSGTKDLQICNVDCNAKSKVCCLKVEMWL